ncbi:hypothetical protein JVT61DRAFT_6195 [Boletus reticuloceps]|uniref:Uncharacterized protein n=1 Tax=Boletus reticuloceps TaxID=495285 RepID=A0A8I2YLN2_9AGAM|nr:hypothetical protein JVT61DRAFT_6195 [Boletus reticuloceps]
MELHEHTIAPAYQRPLSHYNVGQFEPGRSLHTGDSEPLCYDSSGGPNVHSSRLILDYHPLASILVLLFLLHVAVWRPTYSWRPHGVTGQFLACEIIHWNTITLQLNRLFFENTQNDLRAADESVGHVRLSIQQNGFSAVCEHVIQEVHSLSFRRSRDSVPPEPSALDVTLD